MVMVMVMIRQRSNPDLRRCDLRERHWTLDAGEGGCGTLAPLARLDIFRVGATGI